GEARIGIGIIALLGAFLYLAFNLVEWEDYQRGVNWGVIVIYMGALSMGSLLNRTGAAGWIANHVMNFIQEVLNLTGPGPIAAGVSAISAAMTNLMSGAAAASVVGPITLQLSQYSNLDPVFVALLTAVSSSFGFLFIIATPPNAIIYSSGYVEPGDFLRAGALMTGAAFGILFLVVAVWWNLLGLI
ncbi:SLC13 family permease, partial [Candidatus Bipolaricaulota bacterium]|nr:SLC13 family permease [Candidatus Bipolaricaulota bacterium]